MAESFISHLSAEFVDLASNQLKGLKGRTLRREVKLLAETLEILGYNLDLMRENESTWTEVDDFYNSILERIYDLEDLLEECNFKLIHKPRNLEEEPPQINAQDLDRRAHLKVGRRTLTLWRKVPSLLAYLNQVRESNGFASKIGKIHVGLMKLMSTSHVRIHVHRSILQPQMTTWPTRPVLYGRDSDMDYLLNHFLHQRRTDSSEEVEVRGPNKLISIAGFGGIGKTALAQHFYNDERVVRYFQPKLWMRGSDIHEARIRDDISTKRFLIVVDDYCPEDHYEVGEPFGGLLKDGAPGSIILVTTRSERLARDIGSDYVRVLGPISTLGCRLMLEEIACSGRPAFWKEVGDIGDKIAKKCKGWPLAVEVMGNHLLLQNTRAQWRRAFKFEIWQMENIHTHPLYLSYESLSPKLKRCFSYCAVFPKNTDINVEQLIRLWMAQGYLDQETDGIECINLLVESSLFQELVKVSVHKDRITSCKMHELVHDLARLTARNDLKRVGRVETLGSVESGSKRTFVSISHPQLPKDLFTKLKYVRALVLSRCELDELPNEVGDMIHLRYLDLSGNPLNQLPETVCDLYLLEFLDVHSCYVLLYLPQGIGRLKQLRHLRINHTTEESQNLPQGFMKLTSIQTLDIFRVGHRFNDIQKLMDLNDLKEIRIAIHGKVEWGDAKLERKTKLENLELCFVGEGRDHEKASSIEGMHLPPNLCMLMFEDYPGLKLPKCIVDNSHLRQLTRLSLRSALNIESLPALWKLPSLEFLWLYGFSKLKYIGREFLGLRKAHSFEKENQKTYPNEEENDEEETINVSEEEDEENDGDQIAELAFPSLKTLRIENMENLETWEEPDENVDEEIASLVIPNLEELIMNGCPKLRVVPQYIDGKKEWLKVYEVQLQQNSV